MGYDWGSIAKAYVKCFDEIKDAFNVVLKNVIRPIYDCMLLAASAENPKWYFYYKNAKKKRIREKYETLLQNKFFQLLAEKN